MEKPKKLMRGTSGKDDARSISEMSYLPHLDGIRGLAIIVVLLYHFEIGPVRGGFVGVDVFFVLSGFLMTRRLRKAMTSETPFSFLSFYSGRFWRLFPSSLVTVVSTLLASIYFFPDPISQDVAHSALATIFMLSNALFASQIGGYFDSGSIRKPLLHTWSLSLEEQFYLVWPPLVWMTTASSLGKKSPKFFVLTLSLLLGASFTLSTILSHPSAQPHVSWFHLPTRAYEFACGALALLVYDKYSKMPKVVSSVLSSLGLFLVLGSCVALHRNEDKRGSLNFPGWASLPCLAGSVAMIVSPKSVFAGPFLLGSQPMRFIGKVSYSLYLVHWPIWVFLSWLEVRHAGPVAMTLTAILGLTLHYCVEAKLRYSSCTWRATAVVVLWVIAIFLLALILWPVMQNSFQPEFHKVGEVDCETPLNASGQPIKPLPIKLLKNKFANLRDFSWLQWEGPSIEFRVVDRTAAWKKSPPSVVVLGDSMAHDACDIIGTLRKEGYTLCLNADGCYVNLASIGYTQFGDRPCQPDIEVIISVMLKLSGSTKVFLAHDWTGKLKQNNQSLSSLVSWLDLKGFSDVVVLGDHPRTMVNPANCPARWVKECSGAKLQEDIQRTRSYLKEFAETNNVTVVDFTRSFCRENWCTQLLCGIPLFADRVHFNPLGNMVAGNSLIEVTN